MRDKNKQKKYYKEWYENKGREWMKKYTNEYYKKNKAIIRLTTKESYNRTNKNRVRDNLIKIIQDNKINKILTLESKDFIFSNLIPEKKVIVFENDNKVFELMKRNKPSNVKLFFGDISNFSELDSSVDCVYLDFKGIFEFSKQEIYKLKEVIRNSKLFIVTFSLRVGKIAKDNGFEQFGDYQFDLIRRLQELLEINFKVLYGEAYRDIQPMVTIVLENTEVNK